MSRQLMKGNEAVIRAAIGAGCRAFYGYPITPASEITEGAARLLPEIPGGVFLQAESEVAAINMLYGASAAGVRAMTASSGPGVSLMQEGVSYMAAAELPCVIAGITRGGPGLGNLAPEQSDYFQVVKGGGHGSYRAIVLAPDSVQEMAGLTALAFTLADRYRTPVYVLADGYIGQMMEALELPPATPPPPTPAWAVDGTRERRRNLITSIHLMPEELEAHVRHLEAKYREIEKAEVRFEEYRTEGAELVLIGYGIVARILKRAVDKARAQGLALGLLRPITLFPFPVDRVRQWAQNAPSFSSERRGNVHWTQGRAAPAPQGAPPPRKGLLVVELSLGQLVEDVRLAVNGLCPVHLYSRVGGSVPGADEILDCARRYIRAPEVACA